MLNRFESTRLVSLASVSLAFILCLALFVNPSQAGEQDGDQGSEQEVDKALAIHPGDSALQWGPCPEFFGQGCHIAVLHGDPAKPNSDVFFRLAAGNKFPAHRHTSAERMMLVSGEMDVTYEGQETAHLKTGMYAYGPAQRVHHGQCVSEVDCVLFIAFEKPIDAMQVATE